MGSQTAFKRRSNLVSLGLFLVLAPSVALAADDPLARGDAAWERRHEGAEEARAAPGPIGEAVAAYEEALAASPRDLEPYWKLLRALHFQGDYTTDDRGAKKEIFGRGREVAEQALELLAERVGGREKLEAMEAAAFRAAFPEPEVPRIYFWAAANWGLWGQAYGKMAAARQGIAKRVRDYARIVIELDPEYEGGGGYRIHGRLHTEAPKIPLVTGWIDRELALAETRRAYEIAPDQPDNRAFYGDALVRFDKARRQEGLEMLREVAASAPRPDHAVDDAAAAARAREILSDYGG